MSPFRASAPLTDEWRNFDFSLADGVATVTSYVSMKVLSADTT